MQSKTDEKLLMNMGRKNWFWDFNEVFDSSLSAYAILVRLYLARCADNATFPLPNSIAEHCKISEVAAKRAIKELIETGWLQKETYGVGEHYMLCHPTEKAEPKPKNIFQSELSSYAKLVYLYIASCSNGRHFAYPSLKKIATNCSISKATAKRAIAELIAKGWLSKEICRFDDGSYASNVYTLIKEIGINV